jgi:putative tryptophan/tyrosine transport system substrate-binding protein
MRLIGLAVVLTVSLLTTPLVAEAQQTGKLFRIAFLSTTSPGSSPTTDAFLQGMRDLGYVEGQNIAIEWRWGHGTTERFPEFAADVVHLKVDVIVAANGPAGKAARRATRTVPIVIPTMSDPLGDGFVASFAHPGGNITGLTFQSRELQGKRLQLLKETLPAITRVALLADVNDPAYQSLVREAESAAQVLSIRLEPLVYARSPDDFNVVFDTLTRQGAHAVFVVGGTMLYASRVQLAERALKYRLPLMCDVKEQVEAGCLMSYAAPLTDLFRRAATYVDKILKGAKPADLPVEQPTKFELVINMRTAKALGLTIPQSLLLRADRVIE